MHVDVSTGPVSVTGRVISTPLVLVAGPGGGISPDVIGPGPGLV